MSNSLTNRPGRRPGFTLVELLVAMAIIVVLASVVIFAGFRYGDQQKVPSAADRLQGWMLIAKQKAKRDRAPRGIRLLVDTSATPNLCRQVQYIGDAGDWKYSDPNVGINLSWQWFPAPTPDQNQPQPQYVVVYRATAGSLNVDFTQFVKIGDLLEVYGGALVYRVTSIRPPGTSDATKTIPPNSSASYPSSFPLSCMDVAIYAPAVPSSLLGIIAPAAAPAVPPPPPFVINIPEYPNRPAEIINPTVSSGVLSPPFTSCYTTAPGVGINGLVSAFQTTQYRVIRQAQPLPGEEPLSFPDGAAIDITTNSTFGNQLPPLTPAGPGLGTVDILFSPTGGVMNWQGSSDQVILWVRDVSTDFPWDRDPHLITVFTRTGLIAAYPVDTGADPNDVTQKPLNPYSFTRTGASSGL